MWFEILPSAGIIFAAFSVPGIGMYYIHKFFLGNVSFIVVFVMKGLLRNYYFAIAALQKRLAVDV